jgi:hypothetical protein
MQSIVPKKLLLLIWVVSVLPLVGGTPAVGANPTQNCVATNPDPPDGAKCVPDHVVLTWTPGCDAVSHDVYLGTDQIAVDDADPSAEGIYRGRRVVSSYDPGGLLEDTTYYWRIDGVEAGGTKHTGQVWSFTTLPGIPICDPNLLGWWRFEEGRGSAAIDWSGYDHHGTIFGDPQWVEGYDGGALAFDGNDYVEIVGFKGITGSHSRTCCAWIKTDTSKDIAEIITWGRDQPGEKWAFYLDNGRLAVDVRDGYIVGEKDLRDGKWHHVAAALGLGECDLIIRGDDGGFSMTETKLIIDGMCEQSSEVIDSAVNTASYWNVRIGGQTASSYFEGLVDDVRIYDRDVTEEIVVPPWARLAWNPKPSSGSKVDVEHAVTLCWSPGDWAGHHDVYLGTDEHAVSGADTSDRTGIYRGRQEPNDYTPLGCIEWGGGPYYWRIDEVEADGTTIHRGRLWSFSITDYLFVDDFESYCDYSCDRLYYAWTDGWGHAGDVSCDVAPYSGNGTGSTVGYLREPYAEEAIVHEGWQSMPFEYINDGSTGKALYSETERTFDLPQDWTRRGVKALALWFRGTGPIGSFEFDATTGICTMKGAGYNIGWPSDRFHYVCKRLSGLGSIEAHILSMTDTHHRAKAGLMIRETFGPYSKSAAVYITPSSGCRFRIRRFSSDSGQDDWSVSTEEQKAIKAPYWIKLERDEESSFNGYYSSDPATYSWTPMAWNPRTIDMRSDVYIGLAVASRNPDQMCIAKFSNIATTGTLTGQWQSHGVGMPVNVPEQLYVALEDSTGKVEVVNHHDPNAVLCDTWQQWNIDLWDFGDAGVDLESIAKMYMGLGDRDDPQPGGSGLLYFDDIRLYRPRCVPSLAKPVADFSGDCIVDYADLRIMAEQWLLGAGGLGFDLYEDGTIDLRDYAILADSWLQGPLLWP